MPFYFRTKPAPHLITNGQWACTIPVSLSRFPFPSRKNATESSVSVSWTSILSSSGICILMPLLRALSHNCWWWTCSSALFRPCNKSDADIVSVFFSTLVIQMKVVNLVNTGFIFGKRFFKKRFLHLGFGVVFQPADKVDALLCPVGKLPVEIISLVEDRHTPFRGVQVREELPVVHSDFADGCENGRVGMYVVQHVHIQPFFPHLLPLVFPVAPHAFHNVWKQGDGRGIEGVKLLETYLFFSADRQKRTKNRLSGRSNRAWKAPRSCLVKRLPPCFWPARSPCSGSLACLPMPACCREPRSWNRTGRRFRKASRWAGPMKKKSYNSGRYRIVVPKHQTSRGEAFLRFVWKSADRLNFLCYHLPMVENLPYNTTGAKLRSSPLFLSETLLGQ